MVERHFDDLFTEIKPYGLYQLLCFVLFVFTTISFAGNSAGGFMSLGGLRPTYICSDPHLNVSSAQPGVDACNLIRNCTQLEVYQQYRFRSLYEEFEWACLPDYLIPTIASLLTLTVIVGYLAGSHLADHFGRKKVLIFGFTVYFVMGVACAFAPTWKIYMIMIIVKGICGTTFTGPAFTLLQESVGKKHRLLQTFCFHWSFGYMVAGLLAYLLADWRKFLLAVNGICVPSLIGFFLLSESPRWLLQKKRYEEAAKSLNRIAWVNRVQRRFTASELHNVHMGNAEKKHMPYNSFHLFSNKKLAMYSLSQVLTGTTMNVISSVILMGIQDLAGSPFMNTALFGIVRIWTPFFAVAFERQFAWFGRRMLLIGTLGMVSACFLLMTGIFAAGLWNDLHYLASAAGLLGYALNVGLLWNVYKQLTTELFPTVIRVIAIGTFSFITLIGGVVAPQLIYLKTYWFAMPYAGAAVISCFALLVAMLVVPETRDRELYDTLEDMDEARRQKKIRKSQSTSDEMKRLTT